MRDLVAWAVLAWLFWASFHLIILACAPLLRLRYPCFNGFCIIIPAHVRALLTPTELAAVIAHEQGHRARLHVWANFARACLFLTTSAARRAQQEHEADDHAISAGHALPLASALAKLSTHPSDLARIERIQRICC